MFSGIIAEIGIVKEIKGALFSIQAPKNFLADLKRSSSIAVNGICLTIIGKPEPDVFETEVMPETVRKTNLGQIKAGDEVNLEKALAVNGRFEGHVVQGHVDGTGKILEITPEGNSYLVKIEIPVRLVPYLVNKGSVAINGISFTVIEAKDNYFTVGVIPYTWEKTMLHSAKKGDLVNIETDILAKYLEKLWQERSAV